jgi:hypothetical protein
MNALIGLGANLADDAVYPLNIAESGISAEVRLP